MLTKGFHPYTLKIRPGVSYKSSLYFLAFYLMFKCKLFVKPFCILFNTIHTEQYYFMLNIGFKNNLHISLTWFYKVVRILYLKNIKVFHFDLIGYGNAPVEFWTLGLLLTSISSSWYNVLLLNPFKLI